MWWMCRPYILASKLGLIPNSSRSQARERCLAGKSRRSPVSPGAAWEVVIRVALDSVPKLRGAVLAELEKADGQVTTTEMAVKVDHPTRTTRRALEDLTAHHVVERVSRDESGTNADQWSLSTWAFAALRTIRAVPAMSGGLGTINSDIRKEGSLHTPIHVVDDKSGTGSDYREDGSRHQVVDL